MNLPLQPTSSQLLPVPASLATAKNSMLEQLQQLRNADGLAASSPSLKKIIRLEIPLSNGSPLQWLRWQNHPVKLFWSDRRQQMQMAGIGIADQIRCDVQSDYTTVLSQHLRQMRGASGKARYFGGIRFDPQRQADTCWDSYGTCYFVLPQFEVIAEGGVTYFACNLVVGADSRLSAACEELARVQTAGTQVGGETAQSAQPISRRDNPDKQQWFSNVEAALERLATGNIAKVVLSRSTTLSFATHPDPLALLEKLQTIEPRAYHFCFQTQAQRAFIGATPERLYQRRGRTLNSEAVAGTCVRGKTLGEDRRLGEALCGSDKDSREHQLVGDSILAALDPLCTNLQASSKPKLLKQARVQHLYSLINGQLRDNVGDIDLLRALHPTPAVGGLPKDRALQTIADLEAFDRGWFAGPVGWVGADAAEFAVGIRSGMLHDHSLKLFAGAGVVPGSSPAMEWQEMENKISIFMAALDAL